MEDLETTKKQLKLVKQELINERGMRIELEDWLITEHLNVWDEYIKNLKYMYGDEDDEME